MSENEKIDITQLQYTKGVGPKKAEAFAQDGIYSPNDLVYYFPRTYIDRSSIGSLKALELKMRQDMQSLENAFNVSFSQSCHGQTIC